MPVANVGARWASGDSLELFDIGSGTTGMTITKAGAVTLLASLTSAGLVCTPTARTATSDGLTTGTILDGEGWITVTAASANDIIVLPTPTPGRIVILTVGANGFELRSSSPTTVGINGGTGAAAESAIPASTTAILLCETATAWKGFQSHGTGGTLTLVEVAA